MYWAMIPVVCLFGTILIGKWPGHRACLLALILAGLETFLIDQYTLSMEPLLSAVCAGIYQAVNPLIIIIIGAMSICKLCEKTGAMDQIKQLLLSVTNDQRVLVLILTWGFGGFMQAIAGLGTDVAVPAAMLVTMGFSPVFSVVVALIANAVAPAFGSVGLPVLAAVNLTGLSDVAISRMTMGLLILPAMFCPLVIVWLTGKMHQKKDVFRHMWIYITGGALAYILPAYAVASIKGAAYVDIVGNTTCLLVLVFLAKIDTRNVSKQWQLNPVLQKENMSAVRAISPYVIMLTALIVFSDPIPAMALALAGGALCQKTKLVVLISIVKETCIQMKKALLTILYTVLLAKIMGANGMMTAIAQLIADTTGELYLYFSPLVGVLGTFVTGSSASSGIVFSQLQKEIATFIGLDPVYTVAANMAGSSVGKLISPQSIAVGAAAIQTTGIDTAVLQWTLRFCIGFSLLLCLGTIFFTI